MAHSEFVAHSVVVHSVSSPASTVYSVIIVMDVLSFSRLRINYSSVGTGRAQRQVRWLRKQFGKLLLIGYQELSIPLL